MSIPTSPAYKTKNWPAYNEALKRRGSLTIWFDPAMTWEAASAIVPIATHDGVETAKPKLSRMNGCHSSRVATRQTKLRMFQSVRVATADETIGIGLCTGQANGYLIDH